MKKNTLQDMVKKKTPTNTMPTQASVLNRNIKKDNIYLNHKTIEKKPVSPRRTYEYENQKTKNKYGGLWFFVLISLAFLFFATSDFLSKASVYIEPKIDTIVFNDSFKAKKDLSIVDEGISYQLMIIEDSLIKNFSTENMIESEEKAVGKVILYNNFSTSQQVLDINTRLESSNGRIYKTKSKVTIPGIATDGTIGSVEVEIEAENSGEEFNSAPADFNVLAFKNSPKYEKIYARSLGPIEGGFKGKKFASAEERDKNLNESKNELENVLLQKALEQIPQGYILFKNSTFFDFKERVANETNDLNQVSLEISGQLKAFIFEEKKLIENLAKTKFPKEDLEKISILDLRSLDFTLSTPEDNISSLNEISFLLKGDIRLFHLVDQESLSIRLLGQKKSNFDSIVARYGAISKAELTLNPFWERKIPEDKKKLKILINYPK